ncbi:heavy-metal-associated domain-containing protein [Thiobacillus sp.]
MKTSVIEVHDMLSVLTVDEVEKRIGGVPGVESATVNYAAGNATVRYDETRLDVADIKVIVHQRGPQSAGESQPAPTSAAVPTPKAASASASTPVATVPKTPTVAAAAVPAMAVPGGNGQQDKATPSAQPSTPEPAAPKAAPAAMPAPIVRAGDGQQDKVAPSAPPSATVAAPPKPSPVASAAKPSTPTATEPKADSWKVHAFSLTVTLSVAYILCAIFDVLFPPFGLLAALAPASPLPISGSPLAYLTGFALFTVAGFVLGALHGIAWAFWSKRLR